MENKFFKVGDKMGQPKPARNESNPLGGRNKIYTEEDTDAWVAKGVETTNEPAVENSDEEERLAA